jgi:hypothetical protein
LISFVKRPLKVVTACFDGWHHGGERDDILLFIFQQKKQRNKEIEKQMKQNKQRNKGNGEANK